MDEEKIKKRKRKEIPIILFSVLLLLSIAGFFYFQLSSYKFQNKTTTTTATVINPSDIIPLKLPYSSESKNEEIITEIETESEPEPEPEPESETEPEPISVSGEFRRDYEKIRENYSDCIGWIYCENTPINYPIMYSDDNEKYLRKNIDLEYSKAGCIFLDHRNISDFSDFFNVIYGHNLLTDKMFGTLTKYKKKAYYESHPEFWIFLPEKDLRLSVIGVVKTRIPDTTLYDFNTWEDDKETYLDYIESERMYEIEYNREEVEKIVLLSTCTNVVKSERCVIVCSAKEDIMTEDDVNREEG